MVFYVLRNLHLYGKKKQKFCYFQLTYSGPIPQGKKNVGKLMDPYVQWTPLIEWKIPLRCNTSHRKKFATIPHFPIIFASVSVVIFQICTIFAHNLRQNINRWGKQVKEYEIKEQSDIKD
jgi:hypothetical protein